ncbi:DUF5615 family PIN-like protein [Novosphingobium sp. FKTRR1]|uniref:DUF5615 family PIN-like protein n=1 Tax=Novosphingobium sp. FKTRR1 TaxID=2879118 RepID=UPI001CF017B8|nr:DUF5615 family PIN-like protein [Novosphingobium sp. FKTRR1]
MPRASAKLQFFLDQNVPDSIGKYLQRRGHSVLRLRHHIPPDSPDPLVGMTALKAGRILISWDKDFNGQRFQQDRFAQLSRVALSGHGPELLPAVKEHAEVIEFQLQRIPRNGRMVVHVKIGQVRFRTK